VRGGVGTDQHHRHRRAAAQRARGHREHRRVVPVQQPHVPRRRRQRCRGRRRRCRRHRDGDHAGRAVGYLVDGPGVLAGEVGGERQRRGDEVAPGLRALARGVPARVAMVVATEVGDEALAAVLRVAARHTEVGEEEVQPGAVRVSGGGGGGGAVSDAAAAARAAAAVRELDAAAAASDVPHRALHGTHADEDNRKKSAYETCMGRRERTAILRTRKNPIEKSMMRGMRL
jgi:hypothetical protein